MYDYIFHGHLELVKVDLDYWPKESHFHISKFLSIHLPILYIVFIRWLRFFLVEFHVKFAMQNLSSLGSKAKTCLSQGNIAVSRGHIRSSLGSLHHNLGNLGSWNPDKKTCRAFGVVSLPRVEISLHACFIHWLPFHDITSKQLQINFDNPNLMKYSTMLKIWGHGGA